MKKVWTEEKLKLLILAFCVTGIWDVILRLMAEGKISFMGIENMKWVTVLRDYFKKHTVLAAALLAAFVGAIAYIMQQYALEYINPKMDAKLSLVLLFFISAIVGLGMKYSGLYPVLYEHYYKPLGGPYSFIADGMSGVVVGATMGVILQFPAIKNIIL